MRATRKGGLVDEPPHPAVLRAYRIALDVSLTSFREYLEQHDVEDEGGQLVQFKLRDFQERLLRIVEKRWAEGHAAYVVIIKARQLGFSTMIEMMLDEGVERHPGCKCLTVAHDKDATKDLFQKIEFAVDQTPKTAFAAAGKVQQNSTGTLIRFKHYEDGKPVASRYRISQCRVMTARKKQGSRSGTLNRVHLSEYAHWDDPSKIDGYQQSVHDLPGNFLIVETTAFGRNEAYDLWQDAQSGRGDWIAFFVAWWEHDRYVRPFEDAKKKARFVESLGKTEPWRYGGKEELDLVEGKIGYRLNGEVYGFKPLSPEQLHWRRYWIDNKCKGSLSLFHQEMPAFPEQAFQSSGLPVYDPVKLKSYEPAAAVMAEKARRVRLDWDPDYLELGNLSSCPVKIVDDPLGPITLFREPRPGTKCVGAVDVAEGLESIKGHGDTDSTAGYIADWHTGERYARYHAKTEPEDAAVDFFKLSRAFGDAWLLPEANGPGLAFIKLLEKDGFTKLINRPRVEKTAEGEGTAEMRPGFRTNRGTKPYLISQSRKRVEALPYGDPHAKWSPLDKMLLAEQLVFVKSGHGKMAAEPGKHDDLVIADSLIEVARNEVDEGLLTEVQPDESETANFLGGANLHPRAEAYDPRAELEGVER